MGQLQKLEPSGDPGSKDDVEETATSTSTKDDLHVGDIKDKSVFQAQSIVPVKEKSVNIVKDIKTEQEDACKFR